jgi:transcriptional regulator with XRE-family HTH domain
MTLTFATDVTEVELPEPDARRMIRRQAGLTIVDVARVLGVDPSTISRWERGVVPPRGVALLVYARFLLELSRVAGERQQAR